MSMMSLVQIQPARVSQLGEGEGGGEDVCGVCVCV
jgi:hypothetical protein